MAKTNYDRAEDAFEKEIHDLFVQKLLREADRAAGKKGEKSGEPGVLTPKQKALLIEHELNWMHKIDRNLYKILKINKKDVDILIKAAKDPKTQVKAVDLEEIDKLLSHIMKLKKEGFGVKSDEELIDSEQSRHIYKRHNVREKWLPLDTHAHWNKFKPNSGEEEE